ncbi:MAG: 23S rRNA (adenine(2503)-C(2))-methyltransferase RlmN [Salinivirgaceae bacterium]|jgi:23S rRNA (adenine2503-C2)-methyltransferase|nr:23S rRNA (adenine(2503)-C(2))-methyltransferase RlmN [Bacteroidales bacterium]
MSRQTTLLALSPEQVRGEITKFEMPKYTSQQIVEWIYKKRVSNFDKMTNISANHRKILNNNFVVGTKDPDMYQTSIDGTIKYLYKTSEGLGVEAVYIPEEDRTTLCVSSQVGCKLGCKFCMTGQQGFDSNLSAAEIVNQVYSLPEFPQLTNIVFMGMGEPFDNLDEVLKACNVLTSDWGFGWSPRRITVSTVGITNKLTRFLEESNCHLAISLHSPFENEREELMPVQKSNNIKSVINILRKYDWRGQRRLSFEYIMFDGINDSDNHIKELTKLLNGLFCRVNLIRYHETPLLPYKPSPSEKLIYFRDKLSDNNIITTIRKSRGEDISAACGMLSYKTKK